MSYDERFDIRINRRHTNNLKWDYYEDDSIPMWVADMDIPVPSAILDRVKQRLDHPFFGYGVDSQEILDAISGWFEKSFSLSLEQQWIELLTGVVPALRVASSMAGGSALTMVPNYSQLLSAPGFAGNEMIRVPMKQENMHFLADLEALQAAVRPDTRLLYVCNPHNPIGKAFTLEELQELSAFAKRNNLIIVADEIHCELVFEGRHIPFFSVDEYAFDHSITLMATAKTYNIPTMAIGFAIIPNPELREAFHKAAFAVGKPPTLNVEAAIAAYTQCDAWREDLMTYLRGNRDYLIQEMQNRFPKAEFAPVEATYMMWADFTAYGEDVRAEFFRKKAHVALSDGVDFGDERCVRINFACPRAQLMEALDQMEAAIKERK